MSLSDPAIEPLRAQVAHLGRENATLRREVGLLQRRLKRVIYLARIRGAVVTRNDLLGPEQRERARSPASLALRRLTRLRQELGLYDQGPTCEESS